MSGEISKHGGQQQQARAGRIDERWPISALASMDVAARAIEIIMEAKTKAAVAA